MREIEELKSLVDETLTESQELIDLLDEKDIELINKVEKIINNLKLGIDML
tara:strand:- start:103 stop:255 length:153 start_codon:yes stop_codon:yes gene_type:complete